MKNIGNFLLALCLFVVSAPAIAQIADPTDGGAGGRIIRVSTLDKDGPGSLAEALAAKGPRIVVFEVGGTIDLERSALTVTEPHLTIAGQTAPSPGITIMRGGINVNTHDVIVQHLRVVVGSDGLPKRHGWEVDAFSTRSAHNLLIENNSFFWGVDENMSASGPRFTGETVEEWQAGTSRNIVFRSNLAAEGLADSTHPKGEHSKGSLIHDNATGIVFERNVWAHNVERSPLLKGGVEALMINNLIYDLSQIGIPFDSADASDLERPRGWDMTGLVRFTAIMGPLSSLFDIATFALLLEIFHVDVATFRSAWFIESMATQILVVFIIRTARPAWTGRAHIALVVTALGGLLAALALPFLPFAPLLDFAPPSGMLLGAIALLVLAYLVISEGMKRFALRSTS